MLNVFSLFFPAHKYKYITKDSYLIQYNLTKYHHHEVFVRFLFFFHFHKIRQAGRFWPISHMFDISDINSKCLVSFWLKRALKLCVLNRKTFEGRQSFFKKKKRERKRHEKNSCLVYNSYSTLPQLSNG